MRSNFCQLSGLYPKQLLDTAKFLLWEHQNQNHSGSSPIVFALGSGLLFPVLGWGIGLLGLGLSF